jgi:hypothetical protein
MECYPASPRLPDPPSMSSAGRQAPRLREVNGAHPPPVVAGADPPLRSSCRTLSGECGSRYRIDWLPSWVSTQNYRAAGIVVLEVPVAVSCTKCMGRTDFSTRRVVTRASEWRRLLESGEVSTRADIARRFGVSRARVTLALRARRGH